MPRIIITLVAIVLLHGTAAAQEPRAAVGGAINFLIQTHSDDQPGGTALGGSVLVTVRVAPRVSIEFEPSFGGTYSREYSYRPTPSLLATVVASRRDTFFPAQVRIGANVLEPVVGVALPLGEQTATGAIRLRYGVGVRATF